MSLRTSLKALLGTAWHVQGDAAIDGMTPAADGTVDAGKPVVADANKDVTGLRNLTATGTITGAVAADTIAEKTSATGVTIDGVLIKDGGIVQTAGIGGPALAAELTALSTLTAVDFGKTFYINNATGFATTIPAPALGGRLTFINKTANTSGNHTLVSGSSANIIKGNQNSVAGDAGDSGTADDTISFVANSSVAGDKVELHSDGTSWFAYAISRVAAGITFTQAS